MSETGPDLSLNEAKNELSNTAEKNVEGEERLVAGGGSLTPDGADDVADKLAADLKQLHSSIDDDSVVTDIFQKHFSGLGFEVTGSKVEYKRGSNLDIFQSQAVIKKVEEELIKENLLEPEGMLGSLEGFASVAGFNELMEENGVPEEHRDMIMEWVAGFLDMLEETLGLDIGSDLRDLSFTKANGDQALDIAGEAGISLDNIGGTPGLAAFRKDFFNLNKGDGADMDFKDFFENQLDPKASQNKGTALGAVLVKLGKLKGEQLKLTPSQILDLREVSAKAAVPAENGNAAQVAEHSWTKINEAENIAALEGVINGLLGEYEKAQDKFEEENGEKPGHTLIGLLGENAGMESTVADILKARYQGVQDVEIAEAANTAQITLANSVQLQVAYGGASSEGDHNNSDATITLTLGSDDDKKTANCTEQHLEDVLARLGELRADSGETTISNLEPADDADLVGAIITNIETAEAAEKIKKKATTAFIEFMSEETFSALENLVMAQNQALSNQSKAMSMREINLMFPVDIMSGLFNATGEEDTFKMNAFDNAEGDPSIMFSITKGDPTRTFKLTFLSGGNYKLTFNEKSINKSSYEEVLGVINGAFTPQ